VQAKDSKLEGFFDQEHRLLDEMPLVAHEGKDHPHGK
jgi:hypothetical protein